MKQIEFNEEFQLPNGARAKVVADSIALVVTHQPSGLVASGPKMTLAKFMAKHKSEGNAFFKGKQFEIVEPHSQGWADNLAGDRFEIDHCDFSGVPFLVKNLKNSTEGWLHGNTVVRLLNPVVSTGPEITLSQLHERHRHEPEALAGKKLVVVKLADGENNDMQVGEFLNIGRIEHKSYYGYLPVSVRRDGNSDTFWPRGNTVVRVVN